VRNKKLALAAFCLNPILWASFYVIGKHAIAMSDPLTFSTLELLASTPVALLILFLDRKSITRAAVRSGIYAGASLYAVILLSAGALALTSATETAFFPAINGILAAAIAFAVKRERVFAATWAGGAVAALGVCVVLPVMRAHLAGNLLALAAAAAYAAYIFVAEKVTEDLAQSQWVIFSVELVAMSVLGLAVTGAAGRWSLAPLGRAGMAESVIYVGLATTVVPTAISILFQQSVKPVTVAFLYSLEPVWCAALAFAVLGERPAALGILGRPVHRRGRLDSHPGAEA